MRSDALLPICVGVTGYRYIRDGDAPALIRAVTEQLQALITACPHSPVRLLSCLAEGADQFAARVALSLGAELVAILPMPAEAYREDFTGDALAGFDTLLAQAAETLVAPAAEDMPEAPSRDFYYRQADIFLSEHAHVLLALYDGSAPRAGGCGVAETVDFMLHGSPARTRGMCLRPDGDGAVIHIYTPRPDAADAEAGEVRFLGERALLHDILRQTDAFNRRASALHSTFEPLGGAEEADDPAACRIDRLYQSADAMSIAAAKVYRRVLSLLAVIGTVITLAFLLYDELELHALLLMCGLMLLFALLTLRYAARSDCHRRYLDYRALAEALRVQFFLRRSGSDVDATDLFTWTQRKENVWIKEALAALTAAPPPPSARDVRDCWVRHQRDYHVNAHRRTSAQLLKNERIMRTALTVSVSVYCVALLFELLLGGILPPVLPLPPETATLFRALVKILLGALSASTLFAANYYGKLSLSRKASDHEKMALLYDKALAQIEACGPSEALFVALAREELIENGNWCSYQRDNRPDISL